MTVNGSVIDSPALDIVPKQVAVARSGQLAVYDPKTKQLTHISTCFSTHHLMFANDANTTVMTDYIGCYNSVVMERRMGGTLADQVRGAPIDPARTMAWLRTTAAALDAAGRRSDRRHRRSWRPKL